MEREQGSLHDRLRDFGREPRPEILASLQSQLAERRGKKRPAWWLLAAAIVFVSGLSTTLFNALELDPKMQQNLSESAGKDVPLAGKHQSEGETSIVSTHTPDPKINQSQPEPTVAVTENNSKNNHFLNPSSQENTSRLKQNRTDKMHPESLTASIGSRAGKHPKELQPESEGSESQTHPGSSVSSKRKSRKKTVSGKAFYDLKGNVARVESSYEKVQAETGKTSVPDAEPKPSLADTRKEDPVSVTGNAENPDALAAKQERQAATETGKPVTSGVSPDIENDKQKAVSIPVVNSTPGLDSLAKSGSKDSILLSAAVDTAKQPAARKKMWFSVVAGGRYSAVRYYAINQEKSDFRNLLTNENAAFPSRMSFEAGCRFEYPIVRQFSVFGDLDLGYGKEDLYLLATSAVPGQFDRTVSSNSLILNPQKKTQKEHISASIWYSSLVAGFGIQMHPRLPALKAGAGVQWMLMSDVTRQLDGTTLFTGKMNGAVGVAFFRFSASKEIPFGHKGTLVFEPVVQYFLNPVYRMKSGTSILPLQTGVQIGWKW